ncbi:type III secretion system chaperone family protein [Schwartzia succinivorans]|uniref:Putative sensory transduction regulator n=1 Tax=Schwartzia succinivorans DSM 10502 TaxID=1123243 RepID=A0A1M4SZT9_9FIRM|nr:YbjN domain-containing protein [Schwartzia succinivorans]SHE37731.1 Putative sensory transduction regulator [Schwartzia succinivorans DSM 10502]
MNKKAELFNEYVSTLGNDIFSIQETQDDFDTVLFRSSLEVKDGYQVPMIVVLDNTVYSIVRIWAALRSVTAENSTKIADYINQMNRQFKSFKYYVNEDGDLVLDAVVPCDAEHFDAKLMTEIIDSAYAHLQEVYVLIESAVGYEMEAPAPEEE